MTCRKVQGESQDSAVSESVERSRPGNHILISGPRPTLTLIFALFYFTDFCLIAAPRRQRKSFAITHRKYGPCLISRTILRHFKRFFMNIPYTLIGITFIRMYRGYK